MKKLNLILAVILFTVVSCKKDNPVNPNPVIIDPVIPPVVVTGPKVTVSTFAGINGTGFADGKGSAAIFNNLVGIAFDPSGNLFVTDWRNSRIRKITPTGDVSTFAGNGVGTSINGPLATAQFASPFGIATDNSGNIYVIDLSGYTIRKISVAGVVSTIAGNGLGYRDGAANIALFNEPQGLAVDASGNIFVADAENHRIRKIATDGTVSSFAGSGSMGIADGTGTAAQFAQPCSLAFDAAGNLYVADLKGNNIRKITAAGVVTTVAGTGIAGFADGDTSTTLFNTPCGVIVDKAGNLYVADTGNRRIRKISTAGKVTTLVGTGESAYLDGDASIAKLVSPNSLALDANGNLYVTDGVGLIRKITITN